jgi:hypothetical protein
MDPYFPVNLGDRVTGLYKSKPGTVKELIPVPKWKNSGHPFRTIRVEFDDGSKGLWNAVEFGRWFSVAATK